MPAAPAAHEPNTPSRGSNAAPDGWTSAPVSTRGPLRRLENVGGPFAIGRETHDAAVEARTRPTRHSAVDAAPILPALNLPALDLFATDAAELPALEASVGHTLPQRAGSGQVEHLVYGDMTVPENVAQWLTDREFGAETYLVLRGNPRSVQSEAWFQGMLGHDASRALFETAGRWVTQSAAKGIVRLPTLRELSPRLADEADQRQAATAAERNAKMIPQSEEFRAETRAWISNGGLERALERDDPGSPEWARLAAARDDPELEREVRGRVKQWYRQSELQEPGPTRADDESVRGEGAAATNATTASAPPGQASRAETRRWIDGGGVEKALDLDAPRSPEWARLSAARTDPDFSKEVKERTRAWSRRQEM